MNFKEYLINEEVSNLEIASYYFNNNDTVREICKKTGKSMGELYRIIHHHGKPGRNLIKKTTKDLVRQLTDSGLSHEHISKLTGYSIRHIRNIINK